MAGRLVRAAFTHSRLQAAELRFVRGRRYGLRGFPVPHRGEAGVLGMSGDFSRA